MEEATRQSAIDGDLEGGRAGQIACADDGLYRYVPVPPVYRDGWSARGVLELGGAMKRSGCG